MLFCSFRKEDKPMKEVTQHVCGENCPNYKQINDLRLKTQNIEVLQEMSDIFKIFADTTRLRIISTILNTELRVTDICEILDMNRTTISHKLKILRDTKLVQYRKEGKEVYYRLKDAHVEQIILQALDHVILN